MSSVIDRFEGQYGFLSNFHRSPMIWRGHKCETGEHAFNLDKTADRRQQAWIAAAPTPGEAKRRGRSVPLVAEWDSRVRYESMAGVQEVKYTTNDGRVLALLLTGDAELVEGNFHHDQHWGTCLCPRHRGIPGANHLGLTLMALRDDLRQRSEYRTLVRLADAQLREREAGGIVVATGDLLVADAEALVNPVNCVGVMGAGLALQFKRAYPAMFEAYRVACRAGQVQPGRMFVHREVTAAGPRYVINFPTKRHYKEPSRADDIAAGLLDLTRLVEELGIRSIAIPALGCGLGGLRWAEVRSMVEYAFAGMTDVRVLMYPPQGPEGQR